MKIPSRKKAEEYLFDAQELNPGPWVQHSLFVAKGAEAIASKHSELDSEIAYILGCLHDIGRRVGVTDMRHVYDGYKFLLAEGFDDAAKICLTHSFPISNFYSVAGKWDCSEVEKEFISDFILNVEMTMYDKLIQLCDAIALPSGFSLIEKRLVDVVLRRGINEYTVVRWKAIIKLQKEFEKEIGQSIYNILPGVVENTFGLDTK